MGSHGCINGTLESTTYSSPVPVIGLYIAAASFVCMFLMIYDIVAGFRARKRWLPCKLLPLNSVTLTLLSIAAKIPFDLTTSMPSSQDQLSKLCGTTLICIVMGFIMPSLGNGKQSEWVANLAALSIFVITVIVNICIQISTGVIVLFVAEHIAIMCCMSLLLIRLWGFSMIFNLQRNRYQDSNRILLKWGSGSMFHRVTVCYAKAYRSSTQFLMCKHPICAGLSGICLLSSIILFEAVARSVVLKRLKFCSGNSDYDWSMPAIVVTQFFTVMVGCFATTFRWLSMYPVVDVNEPRPSESIFKTINGNFQFGTGVLLLIPLPLYWLSQILWYIPNIMMLGLGFLVTYSMSSSNDNEALEEFRAREKWLDKWILQKRVDKMSRIMAEHRGATFNYLLQILSKTSPSQHLEVRDEGHPDQHGSEVSFLCIVVLVSLAKVSMPDHLCAPLVHALNEIGIICLFIHRKLNPKSIGFHDTFLSGKGNDRDFSSFLPKVFETASSNQDQPLSDLDRSILIITRFGSILPYERYKNELEIIIDFINLRGYSSIEDVYTSMEQLFVDITHALLAKFPHAIFRSLDEQFAKNYEANISLALMMLCKVEMLEDKFQWAFPAWCNISRLISSESPEEDNVVLDSDNNGVVEDFNTNKIDVSIHVG